MKQISSGSMVDTWEGVEVVEGLLEAIPVVTGDEGRTLVEGWSGQSHHWLGGSQLGSHVNLLN